MMVRTITIIVGDVDVMVLELTAVSGPLRDGRWERSRGKKYRKELALSDRLGGQTVRLAVISWFSVDISGVQFSCKFHSCSFQFS